jgi:hypothetical protein
MVCTLTTRWRWFRRLAVGGLVTLPAPAQVGAFVLGGICGLVLLNPAGAAPLERQFSADLIRLGPQGVLAKGRLYVGKSGIRVEMSESGRKIVQILDHNAGRGYVIDSARKTYIEQPLPTSGRLGADLQAIAQEGPCVSMPQMVCRRLGEEEIDGRRVVQWEVTGRGPEGREMRLRQWLDAERGLAVRSETAEGDRLELRLVGREPVDGRMSEKWEVVATRSGGEPARSSLWYDPSLGVVVREEVAGGYTSELADIRIGEQPESLFSVPSGYKRVSLDRKGNY